jgi:hypothetical protein
MSPEPAPLIVSAVFAAADQAWLDALRRAHFPPERNHLAAHLTLFHHLAPSLAAEAKDRLGRMTAGKSPAARMNGLMNLGRGTAIRIDSPELESMREELAEAFRTMLTPQDQAGWRPHVTIQNKVDPSAARSLRERLPPDDFTRPLRIAALALWYYRGGPWELVSRHPFRG